MKERENKHRERRMVRESDSYCFELPLECFGNGDAHVLHKYGALSVLQQRKYKKRHVWREG